MLRFLGFFENDAPDASLPKNAPASLRALVTMVQPIYQQQQYPSHQPGPEVAIILAP